MKALTLIENGRLELQSHPTPEPMTPDSCLVRIAAAGVCGSDIPRGFQNGAYHYPLVMGHELSGIIEEARIGHAFEESLPFVSLLVIFFVIVGMIHDQHLFTPVVEWVLQLPKDQQPKAFFLANGILSAISDNVFVATVYINEVTAAFEAGKMDRAHYDTLAVAINTGTNLPSVATPNGQAAFLFLLTSALAPAIRLGYMKMVIMALPYTVVLTIVGYLFQ